MGAAEAAFKSWRKDEAKRRSVLNACGDAIQANLGEIAPILTKEQGKPLAKANEELFGAIAWFKFTANLPIPLEIVQRHAGEPHRGAPQAVRRRRRDHAVELPALLAVWKIAPGAPRREHRRAEALALHAAATLKLGEILRDVLPAGVLNIVSGDDALGALDHRPSGGAEDLVHRLGRDGQEGRSCGRAGPEARHARARRQRRRDRARRREPEDASPRSSSGARSRTAGRSAARSSASTCTRRSTSRSSQGLAEMAKSVKVGDGFEAGIAARPDQQQAAVRARQGAGRGREEGRRQDRGRRRAGRRQRLLLPADDRGRRRGRHRLVDEEQFGPALPVHHVPRRRGRHRARERDALRTLGSVWSSNPIARPA